jgi:hypothetical protein
MLEAVNSSGVGSVIDLFRAPRNIWLIMPHGEPRNVRSCWPTRETPRRVPDSTRVGFLADVGMFVSPRLRLPKAEA